MFSRTMKAKGFNIIMILLIALWIAVLVIFISSIMVDFLPGNFTALTAIAAAMMVFVCLPTALAIHRGNTDAGLKNITLGLVVFIGLINLSGLLLYVLWPLFGWYWCAPAGQLIWLGAYGILFIPLNRRLRLERTKLDTKIDVMLTAICVMAAALIFLAVVAESHSLEVNGFNTLSYAAFVISDIILLALLSKLMLINMPGMQRYFFAILFTFFFLNLLTDANNLYIYLNLNTPVDISYTDPVSLVIFGMAEVFISAGLLLYSSRNINPVTIEEVKETLQDTQCLMNELIAQSPDAICLCDVTGNAVTVNDTFARIFGVDRSEVVGKANLFDGTLALSIPPTKLALVKSGGTVVLPEVKSPDGKRYLTIKLYPTYTSSRILSGYVASAEDITERTVAEQQILESLEEKKVLLKEIHHRVKNNLQVVSSLLNIQASYITDQTALDCFKESQQRVKSMALIHEKLYQSEDLSRVNFTEYIGNLSAFLFGSYNINRGNITLDQQIDNVTMNIDRAVPCGLIVNELVSNSLKHAFPGDRKGEISIRMWLAGNQYNLIVSDNGVGFPPEIDYRNTNSLGMQLLNTLVTQLDGTVELDRDAGTKFTITFPVEETV